MTTNDFLFEIGVEELPPKSATALAKTLADNIKQSLAKEQLQFTSVHFYVTPRRLAVLVAELDNKQPDQTIERRGPSVAAAYDKDGNPTKATTGFAKSCNTSVEKLTTIKTDKGEYLNYNIKTHGATTEHLLPNIISSSIKKLQIPKAMRWNNSDEEFVRPVHWLVALYGNKIIPIELFGIKASNKTYGHRFMHPNAITITKPNKYESVLMERGKVIADFDKRKNKIQQQTTDLPPQLLAEVTNLVEWPVALTGTFPDKFLQLPREIIISTLQKHQKCCPLSNDDGRLLPKFITISNIKSNKPKQVIQGNEKVINARLSDAEFFYQADLNHSLDSYTKRLANVVFQNKLGSIQEKTQRVVKLAEFIGAQIGANTKHCIRAASLSKADLMTSMVSEFPELQGIIGYYYAKKSNEADEVATAIKEQYQPRFAGDALPKTMPGCVLAIADRIDTLVGIFGINQSPTGEKDPFGLRRAALSVLRIIIEKELPLDLQDLIATSIQTYAIKFSNTNLYAQTLDFILDRLRAWYLEQQITPQIFSAVLSKYPTKPLDFDQRIKAVSAFIKLPEAESLIAANKRVSNILKKSNVDTTTLKINAKLLAEPQEQTLYKQLIAKEQEIEPLYNKGDYTKALTKLAVLKPAIDDFFDHVMVMVDDEQLKLNRLALLNTLRKLFSHVADISLLQ